MPYSNNLSKVWVLIPARGGSKGIPRKCLRPLGRKPLVYYVLEEIIKIFTKDRIIVSTDDDEIAQICQEFATIHHRPLELAGDEVTLDEVAVAVAQWLRHQGAQADDILLTIQPTSPFLRSATILVCLEKFFGGAKSVLTVKDDRHLRWTIDEHDEPQPLFIQRTNRQWLPPTLAETGGIIGARLSDILATGTRIHQPVALIEVNQQEGLDIDSHADWAIAEFYVNRKRVAIYANGSYSLGMGHIYRTLALSHELAEHDLRIVTRVDGEHEFGAQFLARYPYKLELLVSDEQFIPFLDDFQPHLVILDILDTDVEYTQKIKERTRRLVALENLGPGARLADIVINDLYTDHYPHKSHWYGVENAILAPQFETTLPRLDWSDAVKTLLVTFGGTDPQNLTAKALSALQQIAYTGEVIVVLGPGYAHGGIQIDDYGLRGRVLQSVKNMALIMRQADLAITSAGRTVTELMTLGIPTIVLCQNMRELKHTHASSPYGVINLGLGQYVETITLAQHISMLLADAPLRRDMHDRALRAVSRRSNKEIVKRILTELE